MMADYTLGLSFLKREDESLKDYLLSFSPLAPFFGVPYRFAAALSVEPFAFAPAAPAETPAEAPAKPKAKPRRKTAEATEAELAPVPETKAEPEVEPETAPELAFDALPEVAPEATPEAEAGKPAPEDGAPALLYASAPDAADDLKRIRGIGPKLERELNGMGLYTFAQMASLTEANLAWIDENLTAFRGRSVRDDWVGQASGLLGS